MPSVYVMIARPSYAVHPDRTTISTSVPMWSVSRYDEEAGPVLIHARVVGAVLESTVKDCFPTACGRFVCPPVPVRREPLGIPNNSFGARMIRSRERRIHRETASGAVMAIRKQIVGKDNSTDPETTIERAFEFVRDVLDDPAVLEK